MSHIFNTQVLRRRAVRLALLAAAAITVVGIPALPASASTTNSAGTVAAAGACNRYYHTLTLGGDFTLSNRFPGGAYLATRYQYWNVNAAGQRTSTIATTGWFYSTAPAPMIYQGDLIIGPVPFKLPGIALYASGYFKIAVQVGVWNGSAFEFSNWDTDNDGYDTYGQYGIYSYNTVCVASV